MKKGFTLVEIIVSIGIIGLIISTLLLVVYNIQLSQSRMIFGKALAKKAEFYVLKNIIREDLYLYSSGINTITNKISGILKSSLLNDPDFKEIELKNIKVCLAGTNGFSPVLQDLYLKDTNVRGNNNDNNSHNNKNIYKYYFSVDIDYEIKTTKQKDKISFLFPLMTIQDLGDDPPPNSNSGDSTGGPKTTATIGY